MDVSNTGNHTATFASGETIFADTLPSSGVSHAGATVSNQVGIAGTGTIDCSLAVNVITCVANGGTVTIDTTPGGFRVSTTATPSTIGAKTNPTGGNCRVDPDSRVTESNEGNNDCNSDTVTVTAPDLEVSKTNTAGGATTLGNTWDWRMEVTNTGNHTATFASGETIFADTLPSSGVSYARATVSNQVGIAGTGAISCSLAVNVITCVADGGTVSIDATPGGFRVSTTATPSTIGTKANPTGGDCRVDPDSHVAESDETDNDCNSDIVTVAAPDLEVSKSNTVGGATTLGHTWDWRMDVSNTGNHTATFASGETIFADTLPSGDVSYAGATVSDEVGIGGTGSIDCSLAVNVITCLAKGGTVTIDATPGGFRVSTTATPSTTGAKTNPTGGDCRVDPDSLVAESDETDNDCNSDTISVTAPDLSVTKTVTPSSAHPGQTITYTITFTNSGTALASGVVITDIVPVSVTVTSVVSSGVVITDTGASPPYGWEVADLPVGEGGAITITGQLSATLPTSRFTNTVVISATTLEEDSTNNESDAAVQVLALGATVETATGTGTAEFWLGDGGIDGLAAVAEGTLACSDEGKPYLDFVHGFFSFSIVGLTPCAGETVVVTITLPAAVPAGTQYWKCHDGAWLDVTSLLGDNDGDNVLTLTLTDGGLGDDDGVCNGEIVDDGGPGIPVPVGGVMVPVNRLKVLGPWLGLTVLLSLAAVTDVVWRVRSGVVAAGGGAGARVGSRRSRSAGGACKND
jgi:uncharacterized repeat protein (TIGR01451 family)